MKYETRSFAENEEGSDEMGRGLASEERVGTSDAAPVESEHKLWRTEVLEGGPRHPRAPLPEFHGTIDSLGRNGDDSWSGCSTVETLVRGCDQQVKGQRH